MCGIAGAWNPRGRLSPEELKDVARRMVGMLRHRGPDDEGVWVDPAAGVALGHRRLSIIDLSPAGHQPMVSASGRYVLSFNGELYNFERLRSELVERHRHRFGGSSDTEVLLAAVDEWGLPTALDRLNGMFAFALWDTRSRELHLVRDRLGEKPLYYGWVDGTLVFGSELRAVQAHPRARSLEIDRDALSLYLRLSYLPAPHCIYQGLAKLPAGTVLTARGGGAAQTGAPRPFWSLADVVAKARTVPSVLTDAEAVEQLDELLRDAVALRVHSDVPLGAFLSGGIDSSTVVALMQAQADRPVRTFTVGFADEALNEAGVARAVARYLATDHVEIELSPGAALELVPQLPKVYDEPFADPSQLPTMAIAREARRHVTVCLSGDGGDEVFGGYNRYTQGQRVWNRVRHLPLRLRGAAAGALLATPAPILSKVMAPARAQKLAALLHAGSPRDVYSALVSAWDEPDAVVVGGHERDGGGSASILPSGLDGVAEEMMFRDSLSTLPDEMLAKVDRASMAVALETRVPLLDHRVVEWAWGVPLDMRIRDGQGKWLLRQVLHRYVPAALVEGPKRGFDPPIAAWLRGPLRPWADGLLDRARLVEDGYLRPDPILRCWTDHLGGARNWDYRLWAVLMFQSWLEQA